ncbi:hypothetical protein SAMN05660703_2352 [Cellulophaga tyrosinoxydans]|uniref:Uncharacterized protein n=1 Tax=Cellulophaga tyrosinoxydans TaxID=504486 RepID=A0A1W2BF92_9FLAO|nr:hypothetical protein SAMN05660703_2352 [Cellulophaga tyrosinoxydans]
MRKFMKIHILICIIYGFLFNINAYSQMSSNKFELELEKGIEQENPQYYNGLKTILKEFQEHLISKGIIENSDYKSYVGLLNEVSLDKHKEYKIDFNIEDSLQNLAKRLNYKGPSPEILAKRVKYFNETHSKSFLFNQKVSKLARENKEFNRFIYASILLEIYDENDFVLPMVKLNFFRLLDPNSDFVVTTYVGKGYPE